MRRWLLPSAALLVGGAIATTLLVRAESKAPAPEPIKTAGSRIVHVTVYQSNALVTREVEVPTGEGTMELVVPSLPPMTVNSSLYSEGNDGIRVLSTRFRTRPVQEDTREEVRKIQAQIRELENASQRLKSEIETHQTNLKMIGKLEEFTSANTKNMTEKGSLNGDAVITLAKYVMDSRGEKAKELVTLEQQQQVNREETEFLKRKLQEAAAKGASRTDRDAVIVVDKRNGAAGKVRLNYLVEAASWRPQYKFRAGKDAKEAVQLEYLAAVLQQTGEDWSNVDLVLSTAQPMLNAAPPELKVLDVVLTPRGAPGQQAAMPPMGASNPGALRENYGKAQSLRAQSAQEFNMKKEAQGLDNLNAAAALEQTNEFLWVTRDDLLARNKNRDAGGFREGQSVTYHLATRLTVPSRNDEQVIEVVKLNMEPDYFYKAVPVLTPHVYRLANLTNKSNHVLLPGEATMYLGSDFVGRMDLPLVAIGEQFTAGFGVDPQLQVARQMFDKARTMQGGNQVLKYDYRILVSSYKPEAVALQLWDRLPHAESETVGVSLLKAEPEVSADPVYLRENRPNNLLRWDIKVEPTMNGEKAKVVKYEFRMELDRQMSIGSFLTR